MADQYTVSFKLTATDQVSQIIDKVSDGFSKLGNNAAVGVMAGAKGINTFIDGFNKLRGEITGHPIVQMGEQLNALGQQANNADRTFMQLVGSADAYNKTMAGMREVTHGVVADMQLQSIANSMLVTGLAKTADDVAGLTNLGVNLSVALGQDATEGAMNFVAALNNMSYERLDTLGISASAVRERVRELAAAGYDTQEAFKMATLEEGEKTLNRLGDTIEQNVSSLDKLKTRVENIVQDIGQGVATVVNQAATTADQAIQIVQILTNSHPEQVAAQEAATNAATTFISTYIDTFNSELASNDIDVTQISANTAQDISKALDAGVRLVQQDPTLLDNLGQLAGNLIASGFVSDQRLAENIANGIYKMAEDQAIRQASEESAQRNAAAYANSYQAAMLSQAARYRAAQPAADPYEALRGYFNSPAAQNSNFSDTVRQLRQEQIQAEQERQGALRETQAILEDLNRTQARMGELNASGFMSAEQVQPFVDALDTANERVERLQELADAELIDPSVVDNASAIRDQIADAADEAQRMGDNLRNASVGDLLGQSGGGRQGELTDMLMNLLGQQSLGDDQLSNIQRTLDLASGRQTDASVVMEDQVLPMIAELAKADPEKAATAISNINAFLEMAATMNMSQGQIAAGLPGASGFSYTMGGGQSFTVNPGDTPSGISAMTGIPVDQLMAAAGAGFQPGTYSVGGVSAVPGFDVGAFANSMMTGGFPQPGAGVGNPFDIYGAIGMSAPEESPVSNIADDFHEAQDSIADILSSFTDINSEADVLVGKMDEVAKPRTLQLSVQLVGDQAVISMLQGNNLTISAGGGGSGNGRNPVIPGDPRVGARPYTG